MLKHHWMTASGAAFGALLALLYGAFGPTEAVLISFDVTTATLLIGFAWLLRRAAVEDEPSHAVAQMQARRAVLTASIVISLVILVALGVELRPPNPPSEVALSTVSLILSWLFFNCVYALYYAHAYYAASPGPGGLLFPGTTNPSYSDFLYFSFVLGTTFSVSDVQITSPSIRRVALLHGALSFFFNAVVIGLTVNAIATR